MRTCLCLSVLLAGTLIACKGQPHATQSVPAPAEPVAPVAGELPSTPGPADDMADDTADPDTGDDTADPTAGDDTADPTAGDTKDDAPPISAPGPDKPALPLQGQPCPDGACANGLHCVGYYGFAGTQGPRFSSCEIPCNGNPQACPADQRCVTIADGPGQVCRPR